MYLKCIWNSEITVSFEKLTNVSIYILVILKTVSRYNVSRYKM